LITPHADHALNPPRRLRIDVNPCASRNGPSAFRLRTPPAQYTTVSFLGSSVARAAFAASVPSVPSGAWTDG
jgi:hypothetical protein